MLETVLQFVVPALWISWLLYWFVAARAVKTTRWREPASSQLLHRAPLFLTALLLVGGRHLPSLLTQRFLPQTSAGPVFGVVMVALGLGFAVWARRHLGPNWSSIVTLKEGHALIRTGPYGYVRHPIYSGMLLALLGTAVVIGEWRGLLAFALAFASLAFKSRVEEGRMREIFPEYDQYCHDTVALIPWVF
ncbi:MAG: isoprenylcysteine carboxylmethyltransferase family protein [Bradyrhizobiaceae bacterium]|nr:isoprenylcysteine carboxylmethyltransferase family protein [Bradyrhizobiaceae bacterium]